MFRKIVKNFGPEWGAAVMGTAAICITMQLSSEVARPFSPLLYVGLGFYLLATVVISVLVILMGVSFGLIVSTFARSPEAASGTVNAFTFPAAAFGGLWFPVELMPGFMQSVSKVFPTYYAMNAYQDVIVRGKGLLEILPSLSVLIGFILVFFALGFLLFKWKE